jgi:major vault protein
MNENHPRETELVLDPSQFAYYLDKTKGIIYCIVGPFKHSLSNTDQLVVWDEKRKQFIPANNQQAKQSFVVVPSGWYCHLKNPATGKEHPDKGIGDLGEAKLDIGRKINLPGPASFPTWPGQMVRVVQGHSLRSNQYLVVRVYDVDAFRKEIDNSLEIDIYDGLQLKTEETSDNLTTGQLFIVKGTKVHFYIPPNGVEVVKMTNTKDGAPAFVQNAISLEQLQYCILQDEDGNKEYVRGPDVVFPKPTQWFVENPGEKGTSAKKFLAIDLSEISGVHVKVIKDYKEGEVEYKEGEELFITGESEKIYFPREEHAIIRYDGKDRHHAVAIPEGEGRYVLDRLKGGIKTVKGPDMFLPDPRTEVIVRRVLSDKQAVLYFPKNERAREHNAKLREENSNSRGIRKGRITQEQTLRSSGAMAFSSMEGTLGASVAGAAPEDFYEVADGIGGNGIDRESRYNTPRTLTLSTKYDGVVAINVWNGFAVMVTKKTGERRVVEGPTTVLLDYDEDLEVLSLSTGTPKTADRLLETVYLRTASNIISDVIDVETSDLCKVRIHLTYRVNFEGDNSKWFDVENYVKFLCDHARSRLKNAVKKLSIREVHSDSINIIRDVLLGEKGENGRTGLVFKENGMKVSDIEVKHVKIEDTDLEGVLSGLARTAITESLKLGEAKDRLERAKELAKLREEESLINFKTEEHKRTLANELKVMKAEDDLQAEARKAQLNATLEEEAEKERERKHLAKIAELGLKREEVEQKLEETTKIEELKLNIVEKSLKQEIQRMEAEANKAAKVSAAIDPQLTAALTSIADRDLAGNLAEALGPLAMFDDEKDVVELLKTKFGGLGLDHILARITKAVKDNNIS